MRAWIVGLLLVLGAASSARAELYTNSMGGLMKGATTIEVVVVTGVNGKRIDARLAVGVRSGAHTGDTVHYDLRDLPAPHVGDRALVVCESGECPRAIGIAHDGYFQLIAQEYGDGAFITPNVVAEASLAPLAAGKAAPDLCVRGTVELLDDSARPAFELTVSPADGSGKGKLAGRVVRGSLGVVWFASQAGALEVRVSGKGTVNLVSDHVAPDKDGCQVGSFLPSAPVARTAKSLDKALDGVSVRRVLAKGSFKVATGMPVAAGQHTVEFSVTPDGYLELASDLAEGRVSEVRHSAGKFGLGFGTKGGGSPNDPELLFEFPVEISDGYEHAAGLAKALQTSTTVTLIWRKGSTDTSLGKVSLAYEKEN